MHINAGPAALTRDNRRGASAHEKSPVANAVYDRRVSGNEPESRAVIATPREARR
jgi:hypothetical protein